MGGIEAMNIENNKYSIELLNTISREGDMYSLNDLWRVAGSPKNKDPRSWRILPTSIAFIDSAIKFLNVGKSHIIKSKRGKGGGTYGVRQVYQK